MSGELLKYYLGSNVEAFSTTRDASLPYPVTTGHQVHGSLVAEVRRPGMERDELQGFDALVTNLSGLAIGVRTADCVPVLLYDADNHAIAAIHSGWRGTVQAISQVTINRMSALYGTRASALSAVIGPCIAFDSFQVGEELVEQFRSCGFRMDEIHRYDGPNREDMAGGHHIDLVGANRELLLDAGLDPLRIHVCGIDTYRDLNFFSARREGTACGRIINSIKITD